MAVGCRWRYLAEELPQCMRRDPGTEQNREQYDRVSSPVFEGRDAISTRSLALQVTNINVPRPQQGNCDHPVKDVVNGKTSRLPNEDCSQHEPEDSNAEEHPEETNEAPEGTGAVFFRNLHARPSSWRASRHYWMAARPPKFPVAAFYCHTLCASTLANYGRRVKLAPRPPNVGVAAPSSRPTPRSNRR